MGTKLNPGRFDCYEAALPDEPLFVLLGRDPLAPYLVSIWATLRAGDRIGAALIFDELCSEEQARRADQEKAREAFACSSHMEVWRAGNDGRWRAPIFLGVDLAAAGTAAGAPNGFR